MDFIYKREKLLVQHSKQYHKKALVSCYHLIDRTLGFYPHPQSLELPLFSSFHLTDHTFYTSLCATLYIEQSKQHQYVINCLDSHISTS